MGLITKLDDISLSKGKINPNNCIDKCHPDYIINSGKYY